MAYTITTTDGSSLASVADGTTNTSATSLTLIGKNYAGYGIFLNDNYVKLLENFSNTTAPSTPLTGQLWYDSSLRILKVYGDSQWKAISSATTGTAQPASPVVGDLWWDTSNSQLKVYSGSAWVTVGPAFTAASGTSGAIVESIADSTPSNHVVIKLYVSTTVVGIVSKDAEFTPASAIPGFSTIKPGINLISSATLTNAQFTGDASNANTLNSLSASSFLRSDQDTTTAYSITASGGVTVGSFLDLSSTAGSASLINTNLGDELNLIVTTGGGAIIGLSVDGATGDISTATDLTVGVDLTVSGTSTLSGTTNLQALTVLSNNLESDVTDTNTIGTSLKKFNEMHATTFYGTAVTAQYADLAERFEADAEYTAGTVVALGGINEITKEQDELSDNVFGVISGKAAYLMNDAYDKTDETHPAVAMSGRVPVNVIGPVAKGDRLVSAGNGLARSAGKGEITAFNVIGRALEDKPLESEGIVEAIVKINS
jgi:hypothetical protein